MAALLSYGNKKFLDMDLKMRKLILPLYQMTGELVPSVDDDSRAFDRLMVSIIAIQLYSYG